MRAKIQATLLALALFLIACLSVYALFYFVPGAYVNFQNFSGITGELCKPRELIIRLILLAAVLIFPIYGFVSMVIDVQREGDK